MVLHGRDRDDLACRLDLFHADGGDAALPDLPRLAVLRDRPEALLQRCLRIDAVQVVEVDDVGPQALEALLDLFTERLRAAAAAVAALRRDQNSIRLRRERLADRPLAVAAAVDVSGVDRADSRFDCRAQELLILRRRGEPIGAEADSSDLGARDSEGAMCRRGLGGHALRLREAAAFPANQ